VLVFLGGLGGVGAQVHQPGIPFAGLFAAETPLPVVHVSDRLAGVAESLAVTPSGRGTMLVARLVAFTMVELLAAGLVIANLHLLLSNLPGRSMPGLMGIPPVVSGALFINATFLLVSLSANNVQQAVSRASIVLVFLGGLGGVGAQVHQPGIPFAGLFAAFSGAAPPLFGTDMVSEVVEQITSRKSEPDTKEEATEDPSIAVVGEVPAWLELGELGELSDDPEVLIRITAGEPAAIEVVTLSASRAESARVEEAIGDQLRAERNQRLVQAGVTERPGRVARTEL